MTVLLSTAYLPPIAYVAACAGPEVVRIEAHETYRKQTCRNHCTILSPNGPLVLTIPIHKPYGNHTRTKDILIAYSLPWQRNHWRAIEAAYNRSPFFLYYRDYFEPFYFQTTEKLIDFNMSALKVILRLLHLQPEVETTISYEKDLSDDSDLRMALSSTRYRPGMPAYTQVFSGKFGFMSNLSVIDLLFNLGPEAGAYFNPLSQAIFTTDFTDYTV
jgi:hypothetical protein